MKKYRKRKQITGLKCKEVMERWYTDCINSLILYQK